jgi:hypothetical protein
VPAAVHILSKTFGRVVRAIITEQQAYGIEIAVVTLAVNRPAAVVRVENRHLGRGTGVRQRLLEFRALFTAAQFTNPGCVSIT